MSPQSSPVPDSVTSGPGGELSERRRPGRLAAAGAGNDTVPTGPRTRLGIAIYALGIHQRNQWVGRQPGRAPALAFLEEAHALGAGGIQLALAPEDFPHLTELRQRAERYTMHVEVTIDPPRTAADLDRFERDVQHAQAAGATLARTVILPGRRYEQFHSAEAFRQAVAQGLLSLQLAEPILRRRRFLMAVENHKDQRVAERLDTLRRVSSEFIGTCVDVGNNLPLLEDPVETVRAFAPWALTVHLKDQAVREYDRGFLLADVPLGEGLLDLPAMVDLLRAARPQVTFNYETITRDPLQVPILDRGYWTTLTDVPALDLADTWRVIKTRGHPEPFALVSALASSEQLALERHGVERSLAYARERLQL